MSLNPGTQYCIKCAKSATKLEPCKTCNRQLYCSDKCRQSDASEHKKCCQSCDSCGQYSVDLEPSLLAGLKTNLYCTQCRYLLSSIPLDLGWTRGGGPVSSWTLVRDGKVLTLDDYYSSDEDEDYSEKQDYDTPALGLIIGNKRTVLSPVDLEKNKIDEHYNPVHVADKVKQLTKELRTIANSRLAKLKDDPYAKLKALILDGLNKAEEYTGDVMGQLNNLRKLLIDKKIDDAKIFSAANNLRERCGAESFQASLDKAIKAAEAEVAEKEAELKEVESRPAAHPVSKTKQDKLTKDLADLEKQKKKLASEADHLKAELEQIKSNTAKEEAKLKKEVNALKTRVDTTAQQEEDAVKLISESESLDQQIAELTKASNEFIRRRKVWSRRMTAFGSAQSMEKVSCHLCLEVYVRGCMCPMIPCGHSLCSSCLVSELQAQQRTGKWRQENCDLCGEPINLVCYWSESTGMMKDVFLANGKVDIDINDVDTEEYTMEKLLEDF